MGTIKIILTFLTISNSLYAIGIITCISRFYNYHLEKGSFYGNKIEILESIVHYICIAIIYFSIYFGVEFLIG
jgi:hypothetical protein